MNINFNHIPILKDECINALKIMPDGIYVDATLGGGGHSSNILSKLKNGKLIAIDKDIDAINYCKEKFKDNKNIIFVNNDYNNYKNIIEELNIEKVDGILIDLGVSSYQIDTADRGFSYRLDGKLDMRMDQSQSLSAFEVVNNYSRNELINIIYKYGEENFAKQIVNNIIKQREIKPIETTLELSKIVEDSIPTKFLRKGSVAKKTFQAIRIEVNGELDTLENTLNDMIASLNKNGRMAVLTFHSLEDRIVKQVFKLHETNCICDKSSPICICNHKADIVAINKKPIVAEENEIKENSRSTSAKLRIIEKL